MIFFALTSYTRMDLPKAMAQTAGRSSWIPIIVASVLFGIAAVIITKLNSMFIGKVFFDYSQEVIGKFFAYVIAAYYIFYFLMIGIYSELKLTITLESNFLPKTPKLIALFLGLALFAFVSYKGITNVARLFEVYGVTFLIITILICVFMIADGDQNNVLPLFNPSEVKKYAETMKNLIAPFGGLEVLLIIPFTVKNKQAPKTAFFSLLFIGAYYILAVESTIMTLGINNTIILNDSFIEAIKITEAPVIERLDILYLTFGLAGFFSGLTIVFSAVVEYACRMFLKVKRLYIVIAVFVLFFSICSVAFNIKNIDKIIESIDFYFVLVSGFLIPTTVLIIAKIKKRAKIHLPKREE